MVKLIKAASSYNAEIKDLSPFGQKNRAEKTSQDYNFIYYSHPINILFRIKA